MKIEIYFRTREEQSTVVLVRAFYELCPASPAKKLYPHVVRYVVSVQLLISSVP